MKVDKSVCVYVDKTCLHTSFDDKTSKQPGGNVGRQESVCLCVVSETCAGLIVINAREEGRHLEDLDRGSGILREVE